MIVRIVSRHDGSPVGSVQVLSDGSLRFVSGPEDLKVLVEGRLANGILTVRSHITEHENQLAIPHIIQPSERGFEHALSSRLKNIGYCTEGQLNSLLHK